MRETSYQPSVQTIQGDGQVGYSKCEPSKAHTVQGDLEIHAKELQGLLELTCRLEEALGPILIPLPPTVGDGSRLAEMRVSCPLSDKILSATNLAEDVRAKLHSVLSRVSLGPA